MNKEEKIERFKAKQKRSAKQQLLLDRKREAKRLDEIKKQKAHELWLKENGGSKNFRITPKDKTNKRIERRNALTKAVIETIEQNAKAKAEPNPRPNDINE